MDFVVATEDVKLSNVEVCGSFSFSLLLLSYYDSDDDKYTNLCNLCFLLFLFIYSSLSIYHLLPSLYPYCNLSPYVTTCKAFCGAIDKMPWSNGAPFFMPIIQ